MGLLGAVRALDGVVLTMLLPREFIAQVALPFKGDGCLLWPYRLHPHGGYPNLTINHKKVIGTRYICRLAHGDPPSAAYHAAHSCGNTRCVNPGHLRWATQAENNADKILHKVAKGAPGLKYNYGEYNGCAKLAPLEVLAIRASTQSNSDIARAYGVSISTVRSIRTRKSWGHLK